MEKIKKFLNSNKIEYYEDFDISKLSSIRLGEHLSLAVFPKDIIQLQKILQFFNLKRIYFKIIGNASNVLFIDKIKYPVIITSKMKDEIKINGCEVEVSSGVHLSKLCDILKRNELSGMEGIANIPATIGGAIFNGAGAFGCNIYDRLISIKVFFNGKIFDVLRSDINFKHHSSNLNGLFILSAKFLFDKKNEYAIIEEINRCSYLRSKTQPFGFSLGSVYQKINGHSAGFFIERSGLKGQRIGGIVVSNKHANFFVNDGFGTTMDFLRLSAFVEQTVESHFGINLLPEIEKVGEENETYCRLSYSFK